jgi:hypothetical protein
MSALIPFDSQDKLPAYLANRTKDSPSINDDVVRAAAFATLSIKGKVFTLKRDGQKKIITKPDDPDEVAQSIGVVIVRSNLKTSVYYAKTFSEGDSDGAMPDCYTNDGVTPSPHAREPQAKKCAVCPHRVWGSRVSSDAKPGEEKKGRACSDQGRLALATPDSLDKPEKAMLMRVPPASLKNLREAVKAIDQRKLDYNMVVMKVSFDPEAASPTLKFKPIGILGDADYAKSQALYDNEIVRAIVGVDDEGPGVAPEAEAPVSADELDAAIAARDAANKAKEAAKPAAAATPAPASEKPASAPRKSRAAAPVQPEEVAAAVAAEPATKPTPAADGAADMLTDLDALLGSEDD